MASTDRPIQLEIVTPERHVFSDVVDEVYAPGEVGPFGVLPGHTTLFSSLVPGVLHFTRGDETTYMAVTRRGFVEVNNNTVTVLVDACEVAGEIDEARAEAARARAEAHLERREEEADILRATAAMERSLLRLKVSKLG